MSITITVNTSPLAGLDGTKVTSTMIRKRLMDEAETNVAITFMENSNKDSFEIGGRGELQLGVLIETMRREGFELSVSRPRVIFKEDDKGNKLEPFEDATIDVDEEYSSSVIDSMNKVGGLVINLSADNIEQADSHYELGIAPVTVVLSEDAPNMGNKTPNGLPIVVCPAQTQEDMACNICELCQKRDRKSIVGFKAHGSRRKKLSEKLVSNAV